MRKDLEAAGMPDHFGLAYERWAEMATTFPNRDTGRLTRLTALASVRVPDGYDTFLDRWTKSFAADGDQTFTYTTANRLLVGHGNPSGFDVGLSVHHTWGVPIIPGSSIKGLLSHYVAKTYGPVKGDNDIDDVAARKPFDSVTWDKTGRRVLKGPGKHHRALFGAPDAEECDDHHQKVAARGVVTFHDALYAGNAKGNPPFADDKKGGDENSAEPATDYADPIPVPFLTVSPGATFRFAVSGPKDWSRLAACLLKDALTEWGIGGKTSSGYGLFAMPSKTLES
jgi:CRISPR-associated protein Cmr6